MHYYPMQLFSAKSIEGINTCRVPIYYTGSGETTLDKMFCLGAYAPSVIRTHDPLITSREHEPIHHSDVLYLEVLVLLGVVLVIDVVQELGGLFSGFLDLVRRHVSFISLPLLR